MPGQSVESAKPVSIGQDIVSLVSVDWNAAQQKSAGTARWAITMTKVHIRRVLSRTRWQLVTFCGPAGYESAGIVDLWPSARTTANRKSKEQNAATHFRSY